MKKKVIKTEIKKKRKISERDIIVGNSVADFLGETIMENGYSYPRVRPLEEEGYPSYMRVRCSRAIREDFPIGSIFKCSDAYFRLHSDRITVCIDARKIEPVTHKTKIN